jgi:hypothetical protein
LDGDKGASYYSDFQREDFIREGFQLVSPRFANINKEAHNAPSFKLLLEDPSFADVTFNIGGSRIPAHKNILVTRSDYFRAMFCGGMKENKQNEISICNIEQDIFKNVLEFLYTGNVEVNDKNIVPMLTAAEMFQIDDLKAQCCQSFYDVVNLDNIVQLLLVADSYSEGTLKCLCKKYILDHYDTVVKTEDFKSLIAAENRDLIVEILSELSSPTAKPLKKRKITKDSPVK